MLHVRYLGKQHVIFEEDPHCRTVLLRHEAMYLSMPYTIYNCTVRKVGAGWKPLGIGVGSRNAPLQNKTKGHLRSEERRVGKECRL